MAPLATLNSSTFYLGECLGNVKGYYVNYLCGHLFCASESPMTMKIANPSKRGRFEGFWVLIFGIGFFDS
jgi:hypothetical protein